MQKISRILGCTLFCTMSYYFNKHIYPIIPFKPIAKMYAAFSQTISYFPIVFQSTQIQQSSLELWNGQYLNEVWILTGCNWNHIFHEDSRLRPHPRLHFYTSTLQYFKQGGSTILNQKIILISCNICQGLKRW